MGLMGEWIYNGADERVCSVTTGVVKNNWDSKYPGMVRVEYFLGTAGKNVTGWIPVATPYAFKGCGLYALPEIGAEVVIAFHMGDRNCPIVIGSLWNKKNTLPKDTAAEGNKIKRFCTKGGCEVIFEEEQGKEAIGLKTPGGLMVRMEDGENAITVQDKEKKNGIQIGAKSGEVKIFAEQKMILEVGGKAMVKLEGNTGAISLDGDDIKAEGSKSFAVKGQNVKLEGTQMDIQGKSKLAVKSSGMAQIKGATVKIN